MLSFQEFLSENEDHKISWESHALEVMTTRRRKEINVAKEVIRQKRQFNDKVKRYSYSGGEPVQKTVSFLRDTAKTITNDENQIDEAMSKVKHVLVTTDLQSTLKKRFRKRLNNKGYITGEDFRDIAKLYLRGLPPDAIKNDGELRQMYSASEEMLIAMARENELLETISKTALIEYAKDRSYIQTIWDSVGSLWRGLSGFFSGLWTKMKSVYEWARHNASALAILLLIVSIVACILSTSCWNMGVQFLDLLGNYISRASNWAWNFIQSYFGTNQDFVIPGNNKVFDAKYNMKMVDRGNTANTIVTTACQGYAATAGAIPYVGWSAAVVGVFACPVVGYASGLGTRYTGRIDGTYEAMKQVALADERGIVATWGTYSILTTFIGGILTRFGNKTGFWDAHTARKMANGADKIAGGSRQARQQVAKFEMDVRDDFEKWLVEKGKHNVDSYAVSKKAIKLKI